MWLHRVIFNMQARLLGRQEESFADQSPSKAPAKRRAARRVELFQHRLQDLDRRLEQLQLQTDNE